MVHFAVNGLIIATIEILLSVMGFPSSCGKSLEKSTEERWWTSTEDNHIKQNIGKYRNCFAICMMGLEVT